MPRPPRHAAPRAFAPAWLAGEAAARALLPDGFRDAAARVEAAARASARAVSARLAAELARQNRGLPSSPARERHLDALSAGRAVTVTTGQQVGLFTGPAFTVWKALGTVVAARELSRESGLACVPVFWLQTEDHDWDEIDHCVVQDGDGGTRVVRAGGGATDARAAVSARTFDGSVERALDELEAALAERPGSEGVLALLRRHYRAGTSPTHAFRGVLAELFVDDGLVFLDPRTPEFAALARPLLERSLEDAAAVSALLQRRAEEIDEAGFAVQVRVRPGSPLAFFHPDGRDGPRYRLEPRDGGWRLCGRDASPAIPADEVRRALADDPLCASTSALLRPLVQDALLPNAMYVAGPGEIAYFAEIQPLYRELGVEPPLVVPRPSFCVTGAGERRRLEQLGTTFDRVAGERDAVLASLVRRDPAAFDPDDVARRLLEPFRDTLDDIAPSALVLDESLARPFDKLRAAVEHSVGVFVEKSRRSALFHDQVRVERLDRVRAALAPGGVPQERVFGFVSLAAAHGLESLMQAARTAVEPYEGRTKEVAL